MFSKIKVATLIISSNTYPANRNVRAQKKYMQTLKAVFTGIAKAIKINLMENNLI